MNHKYSSIALLLIGTVMTIAIIGSAIDSSELDEICSTNDRILYRYNGTWQCATLTGATGSGDNGTIIQVINQNTTSGTYWIEFTEA